MAKVEKKMVSWLICGWPFGKKESRNSYLTRLSLPFLKNEKDATVSVRVYDLSDPAIAHWLRHCT